MSPTLSLDDLFKTAGTASPPLATRLPGYRWLRRQRHRQRQRKIEVAAARLGAARIVLSVPAFRGSFELDPRSHITKNLLLGGFEEALATLAIALVDPARDVVDVGANAGLYTVLFASLTSRRVLAVEPSPGVLSLLEANIHRNNRDNVALFRGVCSAGPGKQTLHFVAGNDEYASLAELRHPNAPRAGRDEVEVAAETIDALCGHYALEPGLLKVDVEGAENLVFSGAGQILKRHRPIVLSELDDRLLAGFATRAGDVLAQFQAADYRCFDVAGGAELRPEKPPSPFIGEMLALPRERIA